MEWVDHATRAVKQLSDMLSSKMGRYIRQISYLGKPGQHRLTKDICIVGMGGLGTSAADMLARTGAKSLTLIDDDVVELTNLQRQKLYDEADIGKKKVLAGHNRLSLINSTIKIIPRPVRLMKENIDLLKSDLVLDCSDNLDTRYLINKYCIEKKIPYIYCTVAGDHGFVKAITPEHACLSCFYKKPKNPESSGNIGILNTTVELASSLQVALAMKIMLEEEFDTRLISFNVWKPEVKKIEVKKNPNCRVCA